MVLHYFIQSYQRINRFWIKQPKDHQYDAYNIMTFHIVIKLSTVDFNHQLFTTFVLRNDLYTFKIYDKLVVYHLS